MGKMKFALCIYLVFFSLGHAEDGLVETVEIANKSLEEINDTGNIQLPCSTGAIGDTKIILDPEFSLNGVDENCYKFFNKVGEIGPWGKAVVDTINKLPKEEVKISFLSKGFADKDLVCPNFERFSDDLKLKFWVWTFAAISWQESSCKPQVTAQGVNAKAVGLLQLEDSKRLRQGRGKHCEVNDVMKPENNIACGVEILHQQLLGEESDYFPTSTGELFWRSTYWQHLRFKKRTLAKEQQLIDQSQKIADKKTDIKELVMRFPYCR